MTSLVEESRLRGFQIICLNISVNCRVFCLKVSLSCLGVNSVLSVSVCVGMSDLALKWIRLATNWTKAGIFQIKCRYNLATRCCMGLKRKATFSIYLILEHQHTDTETDKTPRSGIQDIALIFVIID